MNRSAAALAILLCATSCRSSDGEPAKKAPAATESKTRFQAAGLFAHTGPARQQWFRITMDTEPSGVPFLLGVMMPLQAESEVVIANGEERIALRMACDTDRLCVAGFPVFAASLEMRFESETRVSGAWHRSEYFELASIPLDGEAVPGGDSQYLYARGAPPSADISGKWVLDIEGVGKGKAEFIQDEQGLVRGSIIPQNIGDVRYLAGRMIGNTVHTTTFNGQHAYDIELSTKDGGETFAGQWNFHQTWSYPIVARRGPEPTLAELHTLELSSKDGQITIPELDALRGKPVIVDLFGTWCPSCMDLMPVLVDLHERYRDRGLEILSIAYEPGEDEAFAKQQLERFREKYKLPWDLALRLGEDIQKSLPPEVRDAQGFPITVFVNRDGTVRAVHSGFLSPAAKADHLALLEQFDRFTREIVDSK